MTIIGIISDTHGSLSQSALNAFVGVDRILHAGDIGSFQVIETLHQIAPTSAVRGNTDNGKWCQHLPVYDIIEISGISFCLLHDLQTIDLDPASAGVQFVIHGHTHQAENLRRDNVFFFNPGSASVRRHGGPLSVGRIKIEKYGIISDIITIDN